MQISLKFITYLKDQFLAKDIISLHKALKLLQLPPSKISVFLSFQINHMTTPLTNSHISIFL
jgi:hypothetical protein